MTVTEIDTQNVSSTIEAAAAKLGIATLKPEQRQIIAAILAERDVLAVLPTGFGKSLCYQVPGLVKKDATLVISPLIALQEDQVTKLRAAGVSAHALHSGKTEPQRNAARFVMTQRQNAARFLYLSPEMLLSPLFHNAFGSVIFARLAIDEAHCVSCWGDSFRPDYQRIMLATQEMGIKQVSAFTATTDRKIEADIRSRTPLRDNFLRVASSPYRANLALIKCAVKDSESRPQMLDRLLSEGDKKGATIVYCSSILGSAHLYARYAKRKSWCRVNGYTVYPFHSQLPLEEKVRSLTGFQSDERPLIIATSAFGMGVDSLNVRQVIHYNAPYSLIDYAQQIGRAGRDGEGARCISIVNDNDLLDRSEKDNSWVPGIDIVERMLGNLLRYVERHKPEARAGLRVTAFMRGYESWVDRQDEWIGAGRTHQKDMMRASIALLRSAGLIDDARSGKLKVHALVPGSKTHTRLLEATRMRERMLVRELDRIRAFFTDSKLDQHRLWQILAE